MHFYKDLQRLALNLFSATIFFFICSSTLSASSASINPIYPENNSTFKEIPVLYQWNNMDKAVRYDFYIFDRKKNQVIYRDQNISPAICKEEKCNYHTPSTISISEGNDHAWRVRSITSNGISNFSHSSFNITNTPQTPETLSPSGDTVGSLKYFFWHNQENITQYQLYIFDRKKNSIVFRDNSIQPTCSSQSNICTYSTPNEINISYGKEHVYRIRAISNNGRASAWSYTIFNTSQNSFTEQILPSYLTEKLWSKTNAYDAGHYLMIPLHTAFKKSIQPLQKHFANQFKKFLDENGENELESNGQLTSLHYYYLMSQYLYLNQGKTNLSEDELSLNNNIQSFLCSKITNYWMNKEAWQYAAPAFKNMRDRLLWKINSIPGSTRFPYYRGIFDEELFVLAIGHDITHTSCPVSVDIMNTTHLLFLNRSEFTHTNNNTEGWLFDSNWGLHPDYKYAGYLTKEAVNPDIPMVISDLPWDSSHFHRFPLWLQSFRNAYATDSGLYNYYQDIIQKLANQFRDNVLIYNNQYKSFFTKNFMNGWNGIYRWGYATQGSHNGYGPYETSGTFLLGWWNFLEDDDINKAYCYTANTFPLLAESIYTGPNTTRIRHPIVTLPHSLQSKNFIHNITAMACD